MHKIFAYTQTTKQGSEQKKKQLKKGLKKEEEVSIFDVRHQLDLTVSSMNTEITILNNLSMK